jgi:hypothetical protein
MLEVSLTVSYSGQTCRQSAVGWPCMSHATQKLPATAPLAGTIQLKTNYDSMPGPLDSLSNQLGVVTCHTAVPSIHECTTHHPSCHHPPPILAKYPAQSLTYHLSLQPPGCPWT